MSEPTHSPYGWRYRAMALVASASSPEVAQGVHLEFLPGARTILKKDPNHVGGPTSIPRICAYLSACRFEFENQALRLSEILHIFHIGNLSRNLEAF